MVYRNQRVDARTGVSPQIGGDASPSRANLETRSQVEDLQRKAYGTEGETPSSAKLYLYRAEGDGPPYVTGTLTRNSGDADADIPGLGMAVGDIYKGERLSVEFLLGQVTVTGSTYVLLELLGVVGQSGQEKVLSSTRKVPPQLTDTPACTGFVFDATDTIKSARLRFRVGSAGGSITIPAGAACREHWTLLTPRAQ